MLLGISLDTNRQARRLQMTHEGLVSGLLHKPGLKEGANKEHPLKHAGDSAHSNQAYACKELRRVTCWTKGGISRYLHPSRKI